MRVDVPPATAATIAPAAETEVVAEAAPPEDVAAAPQLPSAAPSAPTAAPSNSPAEILRPADIAQISDSEIPSLQTPQLHEPGPAAGDKPELSAQIAAMQVTPMPPVRMRDTDRAVLLAEAPTRMTVRIGNAALGKVDFRMSDARTIDVQLAGLLDLLAGHYDAAEFARLRTSAAADAYVSFDQLRALGLNVRYDPVYDEVRING